MLLMRFEIEMDSVEIGLEVILVILQHNKYTSTFFAYSLRIWRRMNLMVNLLVEEISRQQSAYMTAQVILDAFSQILSEEWGQKKKKNGI